MSNRNCTLRAIITYYRLHRVLYYEIRNLSIFYKNSNFNFFTLLLAKSTIFWDDYAVATT